LSRIQSTWMCPRFRSVLLLLACLFVSLSFSCASEVDVEKIFVQANSDDYDERTEARARLLELVQKGLVEPFARGLQSKNAETRVQSMLHLMAIQKPEATDALVGELAFSRRFMAYYNPIRLVPVSTAKDSRIMVAHILLVRGGDPRAVRILSETYGQEPDAEGRIATLYALGALDDPGTIPILRKGLKDPDPRAVQASVEGLTELKVPDISASLLEGLKDASEAIRVNSAKSLSAFHDSSVVNALTQALQKDVSPAVRRAALRSLTNSAGAPAFEPALALLRSKDADPESKENAVQSLQSLTGQNFGQDVAAWTKWWEANRRKLGAP
jgi:HEAT repeat protein